MTGACSLVAESERSGARFWVAPGGGVDAGEELAAAAERETLEETGLTVSARRLLWIEDGFDGVTRTVKFWFLAELMGDQVEPPCGDRIARWFPRDALPEETYPQILRHEFWAAFDAGFPDPTTLLPLRTWFD